MTENTSDIIPTDEIKSELAVDPLSSHLNARLSDKKSIADEEVDSNKRRK